MGVFYPRVLEITKSLSDSVIDQYSANKVFSPRNIKKHVFTMIAKDNIDRNARSTTDEVQNKVEFGGHEVTSQ